MSLPDGEGTADVVQSRIGELSAALRVMLAKLSEEREALRTRAKVDVLERIVTEKQDAVQSISELYANLREALERVGVGGEGDRLEALRASRPELASRVHELVALTRDCQQANQDIGVLVSAGLGNANKALDALHGVPATAAADTYDPQGRAARGTAAENLAIRA